MVIQAGAGSLCSVRSAGRLPALRDDRPAAPAAGAAPREGGCPWQPGLSDWMTKFGELLIVGVEPKSTRANCCAIRCIPVFCTGLWRSFSFSPCSRVLVSTCLGCSVGLPPFLAADH